MADLPAQVENAPAAPSGAPLTPPSPPPWGEAKAGSAPTGIADARLAVSRFLKNQGDVKHADITRLAQAAAGKGCWEAEAEVYVPNATIKTLGLRVRRQVLDRRLYVLRLDSELNVVAYELKESAEASES